jgi:hypothetical protein
MKHSSISMLSYAQGLRNQQFKLINITHIASLLYLAHVTGTCMKVTLHKTYSCHHDVVYSLGTTVVLYRFTCITFVAVVLMMQACLFSVHVESTVALKISNLALILSSQNFLQEISYKPQITLLLKEGSCVLGWPQSHQHGEKTKKLKPLTIHVTFNINYHSV